ncbi:MAG: hypothetical protein AB2L14_10875 [Candidatus Xenobiia bacterium LiM19]
MREISHKHALNVTFNNMKDAPAKGTTVSGDSAGAHRQGILSSVVEAHEDCSVAHDTMETLHVAAETSASFGLAGKLDWTGTASGAAGIISGVYFGITGAADLKKAIESKNVLAGVEAGGHLLLAGEASIEAAHLALQSSAVTNMIGPTAAGIIQSPVIEGLGTAFGVAHGAVESGVGIKEMYDGYKAHDKSHIITGLLDVASGASVAAIALGAGPVAGIALAATFAFQMLRVHILNH